MNKPASMPQPPHETNRARLEAALSGQLIRRPVYAVFDFFVEHRTYVDWPHLFELGLAQVSHATVTRHDLPHLQIIETCSETPAGQQRRDVRWITDIGELREWYLDNWRQEYLIKGSQDYRIMARALSDAKVLPVPEAFMQSEAAVGTNGITLGVPALNRTAFQKVQIDFAGLERFSLDLAEELPELLALLELMNELTYREFEVLAGLPVRLIKLWENLSIETMGPRVYRRHLVPVYQRVLETVGRSGQKLSVHYDGKLRLIAEDIRRLSFDGIESLTPPPEGNMGIAEARQAWPDKFFWLHPCLGWYGEPQEELARKVREMARDAGPRRYCLMISEDVPANWQQAFPQVLEALAEM
jgi:hypothetical protein